METQPHIPLLSLLLCTSVLAHAQPVIQWQKCLGGTGEDVAEDIQQTTDGGSIVAGFTYSNDGDVTGNHGGADAWVVKLSASGAIQWQRALGGTANDQAFSVQQTTDGGYIMAGYTESNDGDVAGNHGSGDAWIVKMNSAGAIEWQQPYGGTNHEEAMDIKQTADNGFIMSGLTRSNDGDVIGLHGGYDAWVVKLNAFGIIQWQHALGGTDYDYAMEIDQTTDGGYIMAGECRSNDGDVSGNHGNWDAWVVRLDSTGGLQWQRCVGDSSVDVADAIRQSVGGSFLMAGGTTPAGFYDFDLSVTKLNGNNTIEWQQSLGNNDMDEGYDLVETGSGGYVLAGSTDGFNDNQYNAWSIKYSESGVFQWQLPMGGSSNDEAFGIALAPDGYLIAGYTASNDGDVSGNHGLSDAWVVKLGPGEVGVNELVDPGLTLYPNPTAGPVRINFNPTLHPSTVSLMDAMGRILEIDRMAGDHYVLDLGNCRSGLYFVKVMFADGTQAIKRVVRE